MPRAFKLPLVSVLDSRRQFIRVDFDPGAKIGVVTPTGETAYDALDLSVYGVSFLVPAGDAERFLEGMEVPSLAFEIDGHPILARGKVIYVRKGLTGGTAKVAVSLEELASEHVWALARCVTEKAGLGQPIQVGGGRIRVTGKRGPGRKARRSGKSRSATKAKRSGKSRSATKAKRSGKNKKTAKARRSGKTRSAPTARRPSSRAQPKGPAKRSIPKRPGKSTRPTRAKKK